MSKWVLPAPVGDLWHDTLLARYEHSTTRYSCQAWTAVMARRAGLSMARFFLKKFSEFLCILEATLIV